MILYTLAQATEPQVLVDLVNALTAKGYEPHGSLCVTVYYAFAAPHYQYVQAMVKKSAAENEDTEA